MNSWFKIILFSFYCPLCLFLFVVIVKPFVYFLDFISIVLNKRATSETQMEALFQASYIVHLLKQKLPLVSKLNFL